MHRIVRIALLVLPAALASFGLDRTQIGGSLIVHFERSGPKVLLVAPNQTYRALTHGRAGAAGGSRVLCAIGDLGFTSGGV
jgi:hypothetical protein